MEISGAKRYVDIKMASRAKLPRVDLRRLSTQHLADPEPSRLLDNQCKNKAATQSLISPDPPSHEADVIRLKADPIPRINLKDGAPLSRVYDIGIAGVCRTHL